MEKDVKAASLERPRVRQELCLGCGLCAEDCPRGAITLFGGKAWIDPNRCLSCGHCIKVCPQGAIREEAPVSTKALTEEVQSLHQRVEDIMARIERLKVKA